MMTIEMRKRKYCSFRIFGSIMFLIMTRSTAKTNKKRRNNTNIFQQSNSPSMQYLPTGRIVGGTEASVGNYPWFAWTLMCSGSLISPQFVLTTADCVGGTHSSHSFAEGDQISVGTLCFDDDNCGQAQEYLVVDELFVHPGFEANAFLKKKNFGLVKLSEPSIISPVIVDDGSVTLTNKQTLWVAGLGGNHTSDGVTQLAAHVMHAEVSFMKTKKCKKYLEDEYDSSMMCAQNIEVSACYGDVGGPLYDPVSKVLLGLISRYDDCAYYPEEPGVYSRIADQWPWIQRTVCNNSGPGNKPSFCDGLPTHVPTLSPTATESCSSGELHVKIDLNIDNYYNETHFEIADFNSHETIFEARTNKDQSFPMCLPRNCYIYSIYDDYGDGFIPPSGYILTVNGETIASEDRFGKIDQTSFCGRCSILEMSIRISISTDESYYENSWYLINAETGHQIWSELEPSKRSQKVNSFCLPKEYCYTFQINDEDGDGVEDGGGYIIEVDGKEVDRGGDFRNMARATFCSPCEDGFIDVRLDLTTDKSVSETSWKIVDFESGDIIYSSSTIQETSSYFHHMCLDRASCYKFRSKGSNSDEIKLKVDGEEIEFNFDRPESVSFLFNCPENSGNQGEGGQSPNSILSSSHLNSVSRSNGKDHKSESISFVIHTTLVAYFLLT